MLDFPNTFWQLFQMYHRQLGFGFIAALLCALRGWHDGKDVKQYAFDATASALLAGGVDQLLEALGMPTKWGYLAAVFIGVFGWQIIVSGLKAKLPSFTELKK